MEQSTTSSPWLWTIAFRVLLVTENAFVWLKIAAPSDLLLDAVHFTNVILTYLLTYLPPPPSGNAVKCFCALVVTAERSVDMRPCTDTRSLRLSKAILICCRHRQCVGSNVQLPIRLWFWRQYHGPSPPVSDYQLQLRQKWQCFRCSETWSSLLVALMVPLDRTWLQTKTSKVVLNIQTQPQCDFHVSGQIAKSEQRERSRLPFPSPSFPFPVSFTLHLPSSPP